MERIRKVFTDEEVTQIVSKLRIKYPDYEIFQLRSDKEFIRFSKVIGKSKFQTTVEIEKNKFVKKSFEIPITYTENVHIFECSKLI
jgi:hypothetical protein